MNGGLIAAVLGVVIVTMPLSGKAAPNYDESAVVPYTLPDLLAGEPERADVTLAGGVRAIRLQVRLRLGDGPHAPTVDLLVYLPISKRPVPVFLYLNFKGNEAEHAAPAMLARGYCVATACYGDIFPDKPDGRAESVLAALGRPVDGELAPDEPGAIAAWAWGVSRILDWLVRQPEIDATRVIVVGHSRNGKAALWAGACDERLAMVVSSESGCGGAALERRNYGETTADITRTFPHWFCPRYATFAGRAAEMPADTPVGSGRIGYHVRSGKHDLLEYDWQRFADFADRHLPALQPPGAIVLFGDGKEPPAFTAMNGGPIDWKVENGTLIVGTTKGHANHIVSQELFQDADIHAEFMVDPQAHGNSGLYLHGHYEMQIYDSFGIEPPTEQDEGALYRFGPPLVNAARRPGEWQVYDIRFIAPRRDAAGRITKAGSVTAWLNGKLVQDGLTFTEPRSPYIPYRHGVTDFLRGVERELRATGRGPLFLQDHGSPTRFRNVWVRPL